MDLKECIEYVEKHLIVKPATRNGAYTSGRTIIPQGCVNHSLGVAQPSIDKIFDNMNREDADWGVNAILGDFHNGEGKIYLTLNWNTRPWGCGPGSKGSYNNSRIQWEVCEPAGHTYNGGTMIGYDVAKNQLYFDRMWKMLVAWNVYCAHKFGYPVECISDHSESYKAGYGTNHADMMHWLPKHGKSMDVLRSEVSKILSEEPEQPLTGKDLEGLSEEEVVEKVGYLFENEGKRSGILASVIFAQWILESGYGTTNLAKYANNFFGMKETLSGNTWEGSVWDGKSTYTVYTKEYVDGKWITIPDKFRKYPSMKESIEDHSAYLLSAKNGAKLRYEGLKGCEDFVQAAKIIKDGGYATDPDYVDKLVNIIRRWGLTKYDIIHSGSEKSYPKLPFEVKVKISDHPILISPGSKYCFGDTGIGVFTIVDVQNGYGLLKSYKEMRNGWIDLKDPNKVLIKDSLAVPFMVKVTRNDLPIMRSPSLDGYPSGVYTGIGVFTIVEVQNDYGLLKSYEKDRNGWISLERVTKI